ncbi:MAG: hypothetical protein IIY99_03655 [Firmicutes bacterium]|nr:hypothetical protein [Bacillota bacterium]
MKKMLTIKLEKRFKRKRACLKEAKRIRKEGLIEHMSRRQIAREIYFHSKAYRMAPNIGRFKKIRAHADPIDLEDGGDTLFRRVVYYLVWFLF